MKIILHEMATYTHTRQLARALTTLGHEIVYVWCPSFQTPSRSSKFTSDNGLTTVPVELDSQFVKRNLFKRFFQERAYGHKVASVMAGFGPDLVISGNTPIE